MFRIEANNLMSIPLINTHTHILYTYIFIYIYIYIEQISWYMKHTITKTDTRL